MPGNVYRVFPVRGPTRNAAIFVYNRRLLGLDFIERYRSYLVIVNQFHFSLVACFFAIRELYKKLENLKVLKQL